MKTNFIDLDRSVYQALQGTQQLAYLVLNDAHEITALNQGAEKLLGYIEPECCGRNVLDCLFHQWEIEQRSHDLAGILECDRDLTTGIEPSIPPEWTLRRQDGSSFTAQIRVLPLQSEGTSASGIMWVLQDNSDQRRLEANLQHMKDVLERTNQVAQVGAWEINLVEGTLWWSSETREIHEVDEAYQPDWTSALQFYLEGYNRDLITSAIDKAIFTGVPYQLDLEIITAKGNRRWIRTTGDVETAGGKCIRVFGAFMNIHERKIASLVLAAEEAKFQAMFKLSPVGMCMADLATGKFIDFNEALYLPTGYSRDEFAELTFWELTPPQFHMEEREHIATLVKTGRVGPIEKEYYRKDRSTYPVQINGFMHRTASGKEVVWAMIQDISERKKLEIGLIETNQRLEEASILKNQFLANISHEIRTPMNGIIGLSQLLLDEDVCSAQRRFTQAIHSSGQYMLKLINDILNLSTMETTQSEIQRSPLDIRQLLDEVATMLALSAESKGLELIIDVDPSVPHQLVGAADLIRQILINLISNGLKFTEVGQVCIRVLVADHNDAGFVLRFEIEDSGIGIPPEKQSRLFQKFSQVDESHTRKYGGAGLGLATCLQLTRKLEGEIGVKSQLNEGSLFWFTSPFGRLSPLTEATGHLSTQQMAGVKVLLQEPNRPLREVLTRRMTGWGMVVVTVESMSRIAELIEQAEQEGRSYQFLMINLRTGTARGDQMVRELQRKSTLNPLKVIMMTPFSKRLDPSQIEELNIAAVLPKPILIKDFYSIFDRLIQARPSSTVLPWPKATLVKPIEQKVRSIPGVRVLIVEDSKINQMVTMGMLKKLGCEADVANDGREALLALEKQDYSLVLMDLQMPVMDGFEATSLIRDPRSAVLNHSVPVIAITALSSQADRKRCFEIGMNAILVKPVPLTELALQISRWVSPTAKVLA